MQVKDLSSELNIQNKDLISYLKSEGYKISSHMNQLTDEQEEKAREHFATAPSPAPVVSEPEPVPPTPIAPTSYKKFDMDDMIECKSVVPYKLNAIGADKDTVYHWEYFGDVEYIRYKDLQAMRRQKVVTEPLILIMDEDLMYQWRKELQGTYQYYMGVDYPEEFFDLPDDKFEELLNKAPAVLKNVIKITAMSMIHNENYPSLNKIIKIDEILGTCMKEFL